MISAVFILPFDPISRVTTLPIDENGKSPDWWAKSMESGNTIIAQVRGDDAVIQAMKDDTDSYQWLEDILPPEDGSGEESAQLESQIKVGGGVTPLPAIQVQLDPAAVRDWIATKMTDAQVQTATKIGKINQAMTDQITAAVQSEVDALVWDDPETAIESVCTLHGQTLEAYRASGLG